MADGMHMLYALRNGNMNEHYDEYETEICSNIACTK